MATRGRALDLAAMLEREQQLFDEAHPKAKVDELRDQIRKWERRRTIAENKLEKLYAIQAALVDELVVIAMAEDT